MQNSEKAIAKPERASPARDRILQAAARLFYAQGIRATGIDLIIAEAGVAKMSFYNHFPSKDDLVRAFLDARHEMWMGRFRERVEAALSKEGLPAVATALMIWFEEPDFRGCAFINTVSEFGLEFRQAVDHKIDLETYLADVARRLALSQPKRVAAEVMVILEGAIIRAQMGRTDGLDGALRTLLSLVAARAKGASSGRGT